MARVKRGTIKNKRRQNVLNKTKGYEFGRSTKERQAREALMHAGAHAFAHRRRKKSDFRQLFNIRLNAALREHGTTYSKFIGALRKNDIALDRKVLSQVAHDAPSSFKRIVEKVS